MKFVLIEINGGENNIFYHTITFDEGCIHILIAAAAVASFKVQYPKYTARAVSAGFVRDTDSIYGESTSLKMKCHPDTWKVFMNYKAIYSEETKPIKEPLMITK